MIGRLGNKQAIAHKITPHFPKHTVYIELFFGAGGMFFNKPRAKYNFLNDLDSEVFNCYDVLINNRKELQYMIEIMPVHVDFWNYCKKGVFKNDVERALGFLMLSNFGYIGIPETLHFTDSNSKNQLLLNLESTYKQLTNGTNKFLNHDFRDVCKKITSHVIKTPAFIYSDPPYLGTNNMYNTPKWTEQDVVDCFEVTFNSGCMGAMSEFDHPFILQQAESRGLNIIEIGERKNMKNRRTEILITNYAKQRQTLI